MVSSLERAAQKVRQFAQEDAEQLDPQEKTPKHWLNAGVVAVRALPLHPDMLNGDYIHCSALQEKEVNGQLVVRGGNQTILDKDYVAYRLGLLLTELGFSSEDVNAGKPSLQLQSLIAYTLEYYPAQYSEQKAEVEREKMQGNREKVIGKAIAPMRQLLILQGMDEVVGWTDEQVAEYIQNMLPSK